MPTVTMDIPEDIADLMVELQKFWASPNGNLSSFMEAKVFPILTRVGKKLNRMPPT